MRSGNGELELPHEPAAGWIVSPLVIGAPVRSVNTPEMPPCAWTSVKTVPGDGQDSAILSVAEPRLAAPAVVISGELAPGGGSSNSTLVAPLSVSAPVVCSWPPNPGIPTSRYPSLNVSGPVVPRSSRKTWLRLTGWPLVPLRSPSTPGAPKNTPAAPPEPVIVRGPTSTDCIPKDPASATLRAWAPVIASGIPSDESAPSDHELSAPRTMGTETSIGEELTPVPEPVLLVTTSMPPVSVSAWLPVTE